MKFLIVLAGLSFVAAKPQFGKDLRLAEGRIIGGEEAPKRNYCHCKPVFSQTETFPRRVPLAGLSQVAGQPHLWRLHRQQEPGHHRRPLLRGPAGSL